MNFSATTQIVAHTKLPGHQYQYIMLLKPDGSVSRITAGCRVWYSLDRLANHYSDRPDASTVTQKWSTGGIDSYKKNAEEYAKHGGWEQAYHKLQAYLTVLNQRAEARAVVATLTAKQAAAVEAIKLQRREERAAKRKAAARKVVNLKAYRRKVKLLKTRKVSRRRKTA